MDWIHDAKEKWREEEDTTKKNHEKGAMGSDGGICIFTDKRT